MKADHDGATRRRLRVLMVENRFANVATHRLPLAQEARAEGFEVHIASISAGNADSVEGAGFKTHSLEATREIPRLWRELRSPIAIRRLIRTERPDICHLITIRSTLLGLMGIAISGEKVHTVCSITGLGYIFTSDKPYAKIASEIVGALIAIFGRLTKASFIFQNSDDRELFSRRGWVPDPRSTLILGSGVDIVAFQPTPLPSKPVVLFCGRYLAHKGIFEFVEAARILRESGSEGRFALAGSIDPDNPASASEADLDHWVNSGLVEDWGYSADVPGILARASILALPSHREGLPKVVLEASACGRPVVTTDAPGCRESIVDKESGLLVPVNDPSALASALARLISAPALCEQMGDAGRRDVVQRFSSGSVASAILDVYRTALGRRDRQPLLGDRQ